MNPDEAIEEEMRYTGLPGIRTWRAMYWFVCLVFVLYVLLLATLPRAFA